MIVMLSAHSHRSSWFIPLSAATDVEQRRIIAQRSNDCSLLCRHRPVFTMRRNAFPRGEAESRRKPSGGGLSGGRFPAVLLTAGMTGTARCAERQQSRASRAAIRFAPASMPANWTTASGLPAMAAKRGRYEARRKAGKLYGRADVQASRLSGRIQTRRRQEARLLSGDYPICAPLLLQTQRGQSRRRRTLHPKGVCEPPDLSSASTGHFGIRILGHRPAAICVRVSRSRPRSHPPTSSSESLSAYAFLFSSTKFASTLPPKTTTHHPCPFPQRWRPATQIYGL